MSLNNQTIQIQYYQDYHNRRADKSLSNFDVTHRFIGDVTWRLPFGHDRRFVREGALARLIGGFSVNAIAQAQSGFPISISATNASLQGLAFNSLRPNVVGDVNTSADSKADRIRRYFNPLFAQPRLTPSAMRRARCRTCVARAISRPTCRCSATSISPRTPGSRLGPRRSTFSTGRISKPRDRVRRGQFRRDHQHGGPAPDSVRGENIFLRDLVFLER